MRVLLSGLSIAGLLVGASCLHLAQAADFSEGRTRAIDAFVAQQMRELHIPGLALALIVDGEVVHLRGYGMADASGRLVTPDTPFVIGSTSKQLTALAVHQLVRDGRLQLDDPIRSHIPDFDTDAAHAGITVRHLLAHTSGFTTAQGRENWVGHGGMSDTLQANAVRLAATDPVHPPGTTFEYSNANYDLLGYLVEVVSGVAFDEYLQEQVLTPLGMTRTYVNKTDAERVGLAAGFYPWFGLVSLPTPAFYVRSSLPSAFVISSTRDLAQEVLTLLGEVPAGQSALDSDVIAATRRPLARVDRYSEYASGWYVHRFWPDMRDGRNPNDSAYPLMYEHNGNVATYRSYMAYVPERRFGLVMTMNAFDETAPSRWGYLEASIMRLALGHEPRERIPSDGLVRQYARPLYAVVVLLQLVVSVWSLRARRRSLPTFLAAVVHATGLGLMLIYAPIAADAPLPIVLRGAPDLGLITILSATVVLVWVALSTLRATRVSRRPPSRTGSS